jgi:hypothetical protein
MLPALLIMTIAILIYCAASLLPEPAPAPTPVLLIVPTEDCAVSTHGSLQPGPLHPGVLLFDPTISVEEAACVGALLEGQPMQAHRRRMARWN